jgi:hypothetical protein
MEGDSPAVVKCARCGQEVANGTVYCPHCCGAQGRQAAIIRGAFRGALFGLLVGAVIAGCWSVFLGADRASWGRALAVVVTCLATGMMWGMIRQGHRSPITRK